MHESLNVGLALIAGVVSFASPCILPLIPAYLSLIGGTSLDTLKHDRSRRWSAVANTAIFVAGFTLVFVALGVLFSSTFGLLGNALRIVNIVAGALVILLGINFIFDFIGFLNFEKRIQPGGRPANRVGSFLFGMAFGAGWTPCIGPILSSILFLAGSQGSIVKGTTLLLIYSLGLGIPFLLTALFLSTALKQMGRVKRHFGALKVGSGLFLVFIGVLILMGELKGFNGFVFGIAYDLESWSKSNPSAARIVPGALFALIALSIAFFAFRRGMRDRSAARRQPLSSAGPPSPHGLPEGSGSVPFARIARPASTAFFALFLALAGLSLTGVLEVPHLVSVWLNFQGI